MAFTPEPNMVSGEKPEATLQEAIEREVSCILDVEKAAGRLKEYALLPRFGLDLSILMETESGFMIRALELKVFVGSRQGGVGFGNGKGEGVQVDLLLLNGRQLRLADKFIRWILGDGTSPPGGKRFAFFDSDGAREAAMGGVRRGKQNNFRVSTLMANPLTWDELSGGLAGFLG